MKVCDINNLYSPTGGGVRTYHEAKLRWFSERTDVDYALIVPGPARKVEQIGRATRIEVPGLPLGGSGYRSIVHAGDLTWALGLVQPALELPAHQRMELGVLVDGLIDARQQALGISFVGAQHAALEQYFQHHRLAGKGQHRCEFLIGNRKAEAVDRHAKARRASGNA